MALWNLPGKSKVARHRTPGGIRPQPHKAGALRSALMPMPLPPRLIYPLRGASGHRSAPLVKAGEKVLKGQKIAAPLEAHSCYIHAATSGLIESSGASESPDHRGAIVLRPDGEDRWLRPVSRTAGMDQEGKASESAIGISWSRAEPAQLIEAIAEAGIVGLGGDGFPTADKLVSAAGKVHTLIIDAVECEPWICADEALLRQHAEEVLTGSRILQVACGAERCIIATQKNKLDAVAALREVLPSTDEQIHLLLLPDKYPAGSESQLVQAVTGSETPAGGSSLDLGALVQNAGTAHAVYRAVIQGEPLLQRITTVTGDCVLTPKNFVALLGTPAEFLLELCGLDRQRVQTVIQGGSLRGRVLSDRSTPVTAVGNCFIAASAELFPARPPEQPCIRCGDCATVCPVGLLPQQLYWYARGDDLEQVRAQGLDACIECGACAWVCPSHIPLVQYFETASRKVKERDTQRLRSRYWQGRFEFHQQRLARPPRRENRPRRGAPDVQDPPRSVHGKQAAEKVTVTGREISREQARAEIAAAVARVKARDRVRDQGSEDQESEE